MTKSEKPSRFPAPALRSSTRPARPSPVSAPGPVDWSALLPAKPLLRVQEVAATLNCSVDHVYRLLATGQIQAAVDLRRLTARRTFLRILRESVLAFLQAGRI